jgi:hypothetical protein
MKIFVASICLLVIGSSTAIAQSISANDFDLACAVTASAVIGSSPMGRVERDAAVMVWTFYLGRLSGRDDKTAWGMVIKERLAEMRDKAKSKELYGKCVDFYTTKIAE